MIGLANREEGYDEALVHYLEPVVTTCAGILGSFRADREREAKRCGEVVRGVRIESGGRSS